MPIKIEDLPGDEELSDDDLDNVVGGATLSSSTLRSTSWNLNVSYSTSLSSGWSTVPMVSMENATAGVRG